MDPTAAWLAQSLLNLKCHAHCWYATAHQTVGLWSENWGVGIFFFDILLQVPWCETCVLPLNLDECGFALLPPINDLKIFGCTETCKMFKKHGPQVVYFLWRLCQGWHPCVFMSVWKGPSVHLSINISRKMSKGRIPFNRKQYRHYHIHQHPHSLCRAARHCTGMLAHDSIGNSEYGYCPKGPKANSNLYIYIEVIEHDGTRSGHAFGHLKWNPLKITFNLYLSSPVHCGLLSKDSTVVLWDCSVLSAMAEPLMSLHVSHASHGLLEASGSDRSPSEFLILHSSLVTCLNQILFVHGWCFKTTMKMGAWSARVSEKNQKRTQLARHFVWWTCHWVSLVKPLEKYIPSEGLPTANPRKFAEG